MVFNLRQNGQIAKKICPGKIEMCPGQQQDYKDVEARHIVLALKKDRTLVSNMKTAAQSSFPSF